MALEQLEQPRSQAAQAYCRSPSSLDALIGSGSAGQAIWPSGRRFKSIFGALPYMCPVR